METPKRNSEVTKLLSGYPILKVFSTEDDIKTGLLKYKNIPHFVAFLFKFKDEQVRSFHTVGMNFDIDIMFYNKKGELVKKYVDCKPGLKDINSIEPSKYVVEIKS